MFKWTHEYSLEVDLPLHMAWDFFTDPSNWPKWEDRFDTCFLDGAFETGAKVTVKIKNTSVHMGILITEVKLHREYRVLIRTLFSRQESLSTFQEISPEKTRIILHSWVISLFTPFMKKFFIKTVEKSCSKILQAFAEAAQKSLTNSLN
jgi:hypothetical protein